MMKDEGGSGEGGQRRGESGVHSRLAVVRRVGNHHMGGMLNAKL